MTTLDGNRIHYGEIRVVGSFSYHPSFHGLALEAIERGVIPSEHVITHAFPLADIGRGFEAAAGGEALKVMVTVDRGGGIG
jgi:L-iditol 2-dehydrogenase